MNDFFKIFKKSKKTHKIKLQDILKERYSTFQNLLAKNNHVLELMADMEEKLSGEYLFDRHYLHTTSGLILEGVLSIIDSLNALSHDRFEQLHKTYGYIAEEINKALSYKPQIPVSGLTVPIEGLTADMTDIAGGKTANLGEIKNRLNLPTPDGFAVTAYAFKRFIEHNRLAEKINERLSVLGINNMEEINEESQKIQTMVVDAEIPDDLMSAIKDAYRKLCEKTGKELTVSVRSSAVQEDGSFSFAGQYSTFLNVPGDTILRRYKEVVASLFTPRAIFYYKTNGFSEEELVMAVGVLTMIDAQSAGVMYTRDPNNPDSGPVIINAACGLGKSVVDGSVTPDSYIISRENGFILEKKPAQKHAMLVCAPEGLIIETEVPDEMKNNPCLTDAQITALFNHAVALEKHYGTPQDIEWAIDKDNHIYILQSRPLRTFTIQNSALNIPRRMEGYSILLDKGVIACKGIATGKAFVVRDEEALEDFPEGSVLVARHTSTKFVTIMNKAAAIITDVGGATGHMASLAREYQVPTILDTEKATFLIKTGQEITVDAVNCNVYEGRVDELLKYSSLKKKEPFKGTHLFMTLESVLKWIVPLNLVDPKAKNFRPEDCKTFHDITRFAHEAAMAVIFRTAKGHEITTFDDLMSAVTYAESGEFTGSPAVVLKAGIPIDAHMIDIDGGIRENLKKATPGDISSVPFSAFLKGMTSMRWPEPRPTDVKGFMGMVAHTATMTEEQLYEMGEKSFAIISGNYMNFSIRLGYHFSMVEAYAGQNMNDNYIKFFFKGGGAARDRRLRRVRLIKEILREMDFKVNVTEDVINASLTKYKQPAIEEKLQQLGKLTAYTKQLDMVMYNDAITDWYIEEFVKEHIKQRIAAGGKTST